MKGAWTASVVYLRHSRKPSLLKINTLFLKIVYLLAEDIRLPQICAIW